MKDFKTPVSITVAVASVAGMALLYTKGQMSACGAVGSAMAVWTALDFWYNRQQRDPMLAMSIPQIYQQFRKGIPATQASYNGWLGHTLHRGSNMLFWATIVLYFI